MDTISAHKLSIRNKARQLIGERVITRTAFASSAGVSRRTLFTFLDTGKAGMGTVEKVERRLIELEAAAERSAA